MVLAAAMFDGMIFQQFVFWKRKASVGNNVCEKEQEREGNGECGVECLLGGGTHCKWNLYRHIFYFKGGDKSELDVVLWELMGGDDKRGLRWVCVGRHTSTIANMNNMRMEEGMGSKEMGMRGRDRMFGDAVMLIWAVEAAQERECTIVL
ncbi:uncharacterized protein MONOS_16608 [Monocercomonoides exilis]|uniref:uncharacterized protein n=1 Tax=Monocercomonoides exilis TaxID=2049356 RepID=UPI00355A8FDB|nr:hypothetical protein MONOS_15576 [Monocercomonoides exilis]KAH7816412.1 hypothetical protein MONOS_16608 [Monocercomonoides exilis]|eukprot:MONOS_15576.1-p1 / transcript=MONOS_15576.1 / gene=MONOS_15576 / organism=Monocercomonoides_exilis_PA203 / gene_product=unspecified product / transcript_product=unspecified product / location=Mono_scaffold01277:414-863(+) / protein_length=150 / sequence_SO=supercontig / SO=protein_coding / is_pseudo=false